MDDHERIQTLRTLECKLGVPSHEYMGLMDVLNFDSNSGPRMNARLSIVSLLVTLVGIIFFGVGYVNSHNYLIVIGIACACAFPCVVIDASLNGIWLYL